MGAASRGIVDRSPSRTPEGNRLHYKQGSTPYSCSIGQSGAEVVRIRSHIGCLMCGDITANLGTLHGEVVVEVGKRQELRERSIADDGSVDSPPLLRPRGSMPRGFGRP